MKKSNSGLVVIVFGLILVGSAFFGGMKYGQKTPRLGGGPNGIPTGIQRNDNGSFINGEILSKDDKSITVKLADGGSKIVFVSNSTQVMKSTSGTLNDLAVGQKVTANGATNTDGSVTATNVGVRPDAEPTPLAPNGTTNTTKS
jgi:hypothetical protein